MKWERMQLNQNLLAESGCITAILYHYSEKYNHSVNVEYTDHD